MAVPVLMPRLGLTMTEGMVVQWNVSEGGCVTSGDVVAEIMTEKITYQVEAPATGVLLKVVVPEGEEVPVGAIIGVIGEPEEDISTLLSSSPDRSGRAEPSTATAVQGASSGSAEASDAGRYGGRTPASPAARKRAENLGIELASIAGSGPKGRITLDDVNSVAEGAARAEAARVGSAAEPAAGREVLPAAEGAGEVTSTEIPYAGMRRSIGERMAASWTAAPMVTHHVRADVHELKQLLDRVNEGRPHRRKISITAAVVMAAAKALRVVPQLNSTLVEDRIRIWNEVNVGVAVAVVEGLIVPVVGRADTKRLDDISQEVARLARRARQNKLTPDEVTGGTFTVSSVAGYGSVDWFTPIINQPEAAILGVGRVAENVVAVGGAPEVRSTMGLSLTFDHRIADGAPAAEWLKVLLDALEKPLEMLV